MSHAKVVVTLAAVLLVVAMTSAQTPRQPASTDAAAVQALTTEIRALRAELAESARTSLRLRLLTARIQAQEQRIIYLDRQRGEAATRRVNVEQGRNELAAQTQRFSATELSALPADQRRELEGVMAEVKRQLAGQDRLLQQAQVDESDAVTALSQEQGRWGDLNTRLEDLERTLGGR
jgi:chromosome segregation ATPase